MWFRFSRPDYFYVGRYRLVDAGDASPFNRGWSQGFGIFVLHCRWNAGRSESDGIHYPTRPSPKRITVNGAEFSWGSDEIGYAAVCGLASVCRDATVTYSHAKGDKPAGTLSPGQKVAVDDGTIFDAAATNSA